MKELATWRPAGRARQAPGSANKGPWGQCTPESQRTGGRGWEQRRKKGRKGSQRRRLQSVHVEGKKRGFYSKFTEKVGGKEWHELRKSKEPNYIFKAIYKNWRFNKEESISVSRWVLTRAFWSKKQYSIFKNKFHIYNLKVLRWEMGPTTDNSSWCMIQD